MIIIVVWSLQHFLRSPMNFYNCVAKILIKNKSPFVVERCLEYIDIWQVYKSSDVTVSTLALCFGILCLVTFDFVQPLHKFHEGRILNSQWITVAQNFLESSTVWFIQQWTIRWSNEIDGNYEVGNNPRFFHALTTQFTEWINLSTRFKRLYMVTKNVNKIFIQSKMLFQQFSNTV